MQKSKLCVTYICKQKWLDVIEGFVMAGPWQVPWLRAGGEPWRIKDRQICHAEGACLGIEFI